MIKAKNDKVAMFKDWKKVMKPESYKKVIEEMGDPEEDRVGGLFTYGRMWVLSYTLVTTIGYGAIVPITPAGQFFTTIYSMITIPFSLYIFASVADEILDWCTEYMLPPDAKSKAAFKKFDTDKNGTLDKRELHEALNEVGFKLNSNDMDKKWKVFKKDSNTAMSLTTNFEVRAKHCRLPNLVKRTKSLNTASSSPYQLYTPYLAQSVSHDGKSSWVVGARILLLLHRDDNDGGSRRLRPKFYCRTNNSTNMVLSWAWLNRSFA